MLAKKFRILLVAGLLVTASISFAGFFVGVEAGSGGFSIAGGMDTGTSLIELILTPMSGTIGFGGGYTQLMGKIYEGNMGKNGTVTVHWGINGSAYFASAYGYSVFGIGAGPSLVEHLTINNIKLLSTQMIGITYSPGVAGYGGGIGFGISGGVYYEF
jgi:hypothetical protein